MRRPLDVTACAADICANLPAGLDTWETGGDNPGVFLPRSIPALASLAAALFAATGTAAGGDWTPTDADRAAVDAVYADWAASGLGRVNLLGRAADFLIERARVSARGRPPGTRFDQHADILRFPDLWEGKPVHLRGGRLGAVTGGAVAGEDEARFVTIAAPEGDYAVAVREDDLPEPGTWVTVQGVVAGVSRGGGTAVPLVAAASLSRSGDVIFPGRWNPVEHRTLGIRPVERALYYDLLESAVRKPPEQQRAAAERFASRRRQALGLLEDAELPTFADVFRNPELYEGEQVTLSGYARRIVDYPAGENPHGLTTLTEASVFTQDSQSNPAVVVAAAADADLPRGDDLMVPVRFTGYFFKMYGFEARDTNRVAPLFLAGRLERMEEPAPQSGGPWLLVLAGLVAVAGVSAGWWAFRLRPKRKPLPGGAATVDATEFPPDGGGDEEKPPLFDEPPSPA